MSKPQLDIIRSPTAENMLGMVTRGFYDKSYIALWLFEVIGREYDDMDKWSREIKREIFIQTCTWSIDIWEWVYGISTNPELPLAQRRAQIMAKQLQRPPINPAQIEGLLAAFTGCPVTVTDPSRPYTFSLLVDESNAQFPVNYKAARELLNKVKPSHLATEWNTIITAEFNGYDYDAGVTAEIVTEFFIGDETPIETAQIDVLSGGTSEVIQDYHIGDSNPIQTNVDDLSAGAAFDTISEFFTETSSITEKSLETDVCAISETTTEWHTEETQMTVTAKTTDGGAAHEHITEVFTE